MIKTTWSYNIFHPFFFASYCSKIRWLFAFEQYSIFPPVNQFLPQIYISIFLIQCETSPSHRETNKQTKATNQKALSVSKASQKTYLKRLKKKRFWKFLFWKMRLSRQIYKRTMNNEIYNTHTHTIRKLLYATEELLMATPDKTTKINMIWDDAYT